MPIRLVRGPSERKGPAAVRRQRVRRGECHPSICRIPKKQRRRDREHRFSRGVFTLSMMPLFRASKFAPGFQPSILLNAELKAAPKHSRRWPSYSRDSHCGFQRLWNPARLARSRESQFSLRRVSGGLWFGSTTLVRKSCNRTVGRRKLK